MEKSFRFEVKEVSPEGEFVGYASIFGNTDTDGEIVDKGAFKRTLQHTKGVVPILWQHDRTQPVGWNLTAEEDEKGLKVRGRLMIGTVQGKYAHEFLRQGLEVGADPGLSIGFMVPKGGDYLNGGQRHFREVALKEYSIVTFPANEAATVTDAKKKKNGKEADVARREFKAEDFNSSLQEAQARAELNEQRWRMSSALCDAIDDISEDGALALDDKKAAISESLNQYAVAMAAWWAKFLDLTVDDDDAIDDEDEPAKAGRTISAATAKGLRKAMDSLQEAMGYSKMAQAAKTKAIGVLGDLSTGRYANDVNKPNPVGGGGKEGDSDLLHSLLDATRTGAHKATTA